MTAHELTAPALIERSAKAVWEVAGHTNDYDSYEQVTEEVRDLVRAYACASLAEFLAALRESAMVERLAKSVCCPQGCLASPESVHCQRCVVAVRNFGSDAIPAVLAAIAREAGL
jgi:hypothetical protein